MKKLIVCLLAILLSSTAFTQSVYKAFMTEGYRWNSYLKEWQLDVTHKDTHIDIYILERRIDIDANSPVTIILKYGSKDISGKDWTGKRWEGYADGEDCTIDLIKFEGENYFLLSLLTNNCSYNLRYYCR